jgi:pimeloyl-ACP methyl ester carboxylesterase
MGVAATTGLVVGGGLVILFLSVVLYGRVAAVSWERTPYPPGKLVHAADTKLYVRVEGKGTPVVVIEPALGSPGAEWWHVQDELSKTTTVVTYDRAGYGWSRPGAYPRTSRQVVSELHAMLRNLELPGPYVLVGHAQGALYMQLYGRLYPDDVAGAVFIDPMSSDNQRFKAELKPDVYRNSGVDRFARIKWLGTLQRLGLMRVLRGMLEAKVLASHHGLPAATREVIWQHYTLPKAYAAIMDEDSQNSTPANGVEVRNAGTFPHAPVKVLYHAPRRMVKDMMQFGGLQKDDADEVEAIWEQLSRGYLRLSPRGEWIVAQQSGHFIHLDQPDMVVSEIAELVNSIRTATAPTAQDGA